MATINRSICCSCDIVGIAFVNVFTADRTITTAIISMITFAFVTTISIATFSIRVTVVRILETFIDIETLDTITFVTYLTIAMETTLNIGTFCMQIAVVCPKITFVIIITIFAIFLISSIACTSIGTRSIYTILLTDISTSKTFINVNAVETITIKTSKTFAGV